MYSDFLKMAKIGNLRMSEPPPLLRIPPLDPTFYAAREHWVSTFLKAAEEAANDPSNTDSNDLLHRTLRKGTPLSIKDQLAEMLFVLHFLRRRILDGLDNRFHTSAPP